MAAGTLSAKEIFQAQGSSTKAHQLSQLKEHNAVEIPDEEETEVLDEEDSVMKGAPFKGRS